MDIAEKKIINDHQKYSKNGGKMTLREYKKAIGYKEDYSIVGKVFTERNLLALYPIVVSGNEKKKEDLNHIIKDFKNKKCNFCMVTFKKGGVEKFCILRKRCKDEIIKANVIGSFSERKNIKYPKVEVINAWDEE